MGIEENQSGQIEDEKKEEADRFMKEAVGAVKGLASMNRVRKTTLSIQQKLDIVQKLDSGASISLISSEYFIHPATARRIRRNGSALHHLGTRGAFTRKLKRLRKPKYAELEDHLHTWFLERRALGDPITDLLLQEKAQEMARQFDATEFKASMGWVAKFKNRHDIRLSNHTSSEKGNAEVAEEFVASLTRQIEEEDIQCENIYNMDETGLTWKAVPTKTLVHGKEVDVKLEGMKLKKDRVSVGLCTNATGTHKLTPLFIYKYHNPRALKNMMNHLPVIFKAQEHAWLDRKIFTDWYDNHFKPAVRKRQLESGGSGKVLLLLDNWGGHKLQPSKYQKDNNFEIVIMPPNTTSIIQPMDQGIFTKTKGSFRHKMLRHILAYPGGLQEFHEKYNLKHCIDFLHEAWADVNATHIVHAWRKIIRTIPLVTLAPEDATDPLATQLEDMVGAIIGEEPCQERVTEFLIKCEEAEAFSEEEIEDADEQEESEEEEEGPEEQVEEPEEREQQAVQAEQIKEEMPEEQIKEEYVREHHQQEEQGNAQGEHLWEETRKRQLEELFNELSTYAQQEPRFIQQTIVNLREHFLRK